MGSRNEIGSIISERNMADKDSIKGQCYIGRIFSLQLSIPFKFANGNEHYKTLECPMAVETSLRVLQLVKELHQHNHIDDMTNKWFCETPRAWFSLATQA